MDIKINTNNLYKENMINNLMDKSKLFIIDYETLLTNYNNLMIKYTNLVKLQEKNKNLKEENKKLNLMNLDLKFKLEANNNDVAKYIKKELEDTELILKLDKKIDELRTENRILKSKIDLKD